MARPKVIYKEEGVGKIVKYSNNRFDGEDYYVIQNNEGNCVYTIPQRLMIGNLSDLLHRYVNKC